VLAPRESYYARLATRFHQALVVARPAVRDHLWLMSDERPPDVISLLPRSRPHRRSAKRAAPPNGSIAAMAAGDCTADADAPPPRRQTAEPPTGGSSAPPLVATAVQAAAELAELCLSLSARAIRATLARLPRP
jgi:hypothetical protein